jgi:gliding motility-associated-like protein
VYDIPFINGLIKDDECNEGIGSIKTTVTDGANPYTYLWNDRVNTKDNLGLTEGTYTLTVTDDNGCKGDYVGSLLNLQDDSCDDTYLFVPNIFSPDGNGVNDILFVDGKNIQQVQLMIYNRWGNLVFQSNSVAEGWDGNFKGKPVNQGVFVYIVTGRFKDGKDFDQKGTITLIRKK